MANLIFNDFIDVLFPRTSAKVTMPGVKNIIFNGNITKVMFTVGTWSLVRLSENDKPDREVAVLYAIAKRIFGRISYDHKNYGEAVESGIGSKLRKWVAAGYDQEVADMVKRTAKKAKKAKAKLEPEHCTTGDKPSKSAGRTCTCCCGSEYVRPDKPFSKFTAEEKRAYWREQSRRRRA